MALTASKGPRPEPEAGDSAPLVLSGAFLAGLVLVYLGRRVLPTPELVSTALTAAGVLACTGSTLARLRGVAVGCRRRAKSVSGMLLAVQALGLAGVAGLLFAASYAGMPGRETLYAALTVFSLVVVAVSVVATLFAEVALGPMRTGIHWEGRRVQLAAASGATLALAIAYCSLLVFAAGRSSLRADYSYFRTSAPGPATVALVQELGAELQINAFFPEINEVGAEVGAYLAQLDALGAPVAVRFVDRFMEPKVAQALQVTRDGVITIGLGEASEQLTLGVELAQARPKLVKLDEELHTRLLKLLRSARTAYLTVGHGELPLRGREGGEQGQGAQGVTTMLQQQNYRVKELGLAQGLGAAVPDDAALVAVLGPTSPFATAELVALKAYADAGGKLLIALDRDDWQQSTPPSGDDVAALRALVAVAGVGYEGEQLADEEQFIPRRRNDSDHKNIFSNRFASHASVSTLSRNAQRATVVFAGASALEPLAQNDGTTDIVVRSLSTAFADANGNLHHDPGEPSRSFALALAVARRVDPASLPAGRSPPGKTDAQRDPHGEMRAFVLGDADVLSDSLLSSFPANRMLFIDAVRWLGGDASLVRELENEADIRIEHSQAQDLVWFYSLIFGMPSLVLAIGLLLGRRLRPRASVRS